MTDPAERRIFDLSHQRDRIDILARDLAVDLEYLDSHYAEQNFAWRARWMAGNLASLVLSIDSAARAAGREEERERLMHYIQHEPDCAERTPEGDCVCGLAAILDAPAEEELTRALERAWREIVRSFGGR